jgi:hypothetical protein
MPCLPKLKLITTSRMPDPTQGQPTKLQRAYDFLKSKDVTVPESYEEFEGGIQQEGRLQKMYDYLKSADVVVPADFKEFEASMLADVKKKDQQVSGNAAGTSYSPEPFPGFQQDGVEVATPAGAVPGAPGDVPAEVPTVATAGPESVIQPDDPARFPNGYTQPEGLDALATGRSAVEAVPGDAAIAAGQAPPSIEQLRAENEQDGFWSSLGKSLGNSLNPNKIAGNVVDYLGDMGEQLTRYPVLGVGSIGLSAIDGRPLSENKATDEYAREQLALAKKKEFPLSDNAKASILDEPTNPAAWGSLLGQGAGSIVQVAGASLLGGPGAGIAAGSALGISATKDAARANGISDKEAALTATVLAPIQGVLEELGMGFITKNPAAARLLQAEIIKRALSYGEGKLAKSALVRAASELMPEVVKRYGGRALAGAAGEGTTEALQGEAEGIAQLTADAVRPAGEKGYGVTPYDALVKNPLEQGIAGAILGGAAGSLHGSPQLTGANVGQSAPALQFEVPADVSPEEQQAAQQAYPEPVQIVRPTGQVMFPNAQVVALSPDGKMARIVSEDGQGQPVDTNVPVEYIAQQPAPQAEAAVPEPVAPVPTPELVQPVQGQNDSGNLPPENVGLPAPEAPLAVPQADPQAQAVSGSVEPGIIDVPGQDEVLPAEEPAPAQEAPAEPVAAPKHAKALTPQQQDTNTVIDALASYNEMGPRDRKSKKGQAARAELATLAEKAGLDLAVDNDFGVTVTRGGKRVTRTNEVTGTTAVEGHVPARDRAPEVRDAALGLATRVANGSGEFVALGVEVNGKRLNARDAKAAAQDILDGRNTHRADLLLNKIQEVQESGFAEVSTGTGLLTKKERIPAEDFFGNPDTASIKSKQEIPLSDAEVDALIAEDDNVAQAIADYTREDGSVDFGKLADDEHALPFLFGVSDDIATKLSTLARERANQTPAPETGANPGAEAQSVSGTASPYSAGGSAAQEVEPWQMRRADFLNAEEYERDYRSQYVDEQGNKVQSSRTTPSSKPIPAVGTWRISDTGKWDKYGDGIEQLREIPVDKVIGVENPEGEGRGDDVVRYSEWLGEGKNAPPVRAIELPGGKFKINDGHRRLAAHKRAGKKTMLAWVAPTADTGKRGAHDTVIDTDLTHQLAVEAAMKEGKPVPAEVLADYPAIAEKYAAQEVAPKLSLREQNAAAKAELSDALAEFQAARKKKGTGMALSSLAGISSFTAEESAAIVKMVKALVKLGAVNSKRVIAGLRSYGLSEDDATDDQLRPLVKQTLKDEGVFRAKAAGARTEPALTDNAKERKSMQNAKASDQVADPVKERIAASKLDLYEPRSLADAKATAELEIQRIGVEAAVALAVNPPSSMHGDVKTALRVGVLEALNAQSDAALAAGDQVEAERLYDHSYAVAEALAKTGTDLGQQINAYKLLARHSPAAVVVAAQKEVKTQRDKKVAKVTDKAKKVASRTRKVQKEVVTATLNSPAVAKAKAKAGAAVVVSANQQAIAQVKATRADLFAELRKLTGVIAIVSPQQRIAELHVAIFRTYLTEGMLRVKDMVARLRREAGPSVRGISDTDLTARATTALAQHHVAARNAEAALEQAKRELGVKLDAVVRLHATQQDATGRTLAEKLVADAGLSPADAASFAAAVEAEFAKQVASRRESILDRVHAKLGAILPTRKTKTALVKLLETLNLSPVTDQRVTDILQDQLDLPTLTPQDVQELRRLAEAVQAAPAGFQKDDAVSKLLAAQAKVKGVDLLEIGNAMWYANVLSNPKTHFINFVANVLQTGAELTVNTIYNAGNLRFAGAPARGMVQGFRQGALEAKSVLTTGREVSRDGSKYEVPGLLETIAFKGGKLNPASYLKFVTRALRAGDVLFSSGLKEMRAYELAMRDAIETRPDGEPTADTWARVYESLYNTTARVQAAEAQARTEGLAGMDFKRRIFELVEQSRPDKPRLEAREYAVRAVFNGDVKGGLGVVATRIQSLTEGFVMQTPVGEFKPAKYIVPFTRVITNVANAYLDYTPVGALRAAKGTTLFGGKADTNTFQTFTLEEQQKLMVKAALGSALLVAAYALSHDKDGEDKPTLEISGAGTGDPDKDQQLRLTGWAPYSIKVKGTNKWVSYANLPIGTMLSVAGNLSDDEKYRAADMEKDDAAVQRVWMNAFRALQYTKDMTALKGAANFLATLDSRNPTAIVRALGNQAAASVTGYLPFAALEAQLAKDYDNLNGQGKKEARSFSEKLIQNIPVARQGLTDAVDVLGDPVAQDTDRIFSSPPVRDAETQKVWDFLQANGLFISVPPRMVGSTAILNFTKRTESQMTNEEYYRFMKQRGGFIKQRLIGYVARTNGTTNKAQLQKGLNALTEQATIQAKLAVFVAGK